MEKISELRVDDIEICDDERKQQIIELRGSDNTFELTDTFAIINYTFASKLNGKKAVSHDGIVIRDGRVLQGW